MPPDRHLERVARGVWTDVACGILTEADAQAEIALRAEMTTERMDRRRQQLERGWRDRGQRQRRAHLDAAKSAPLIEQSKTQVFQLRRKALNSAKTEAPVNNVEVRRGGLYCTHSEALASGFCPDCEQTVNLLPANVDDPEGEALRRRPDQEPR